MSVVLNTPKSNEPSVSMNHKTNNKQSFLFGKENYVIMLVGLAVIILGFILMSGGKSADPKVFNEDEMYSFRRITLAPFLVIAGLVIEAYAIMRKPKS